MTRYSVLLLCSFTLLAQSSDPARDERWRQDLQFLATELVRVHPDFFTQTSREDFNRAVTQLNDSIPTKADYQILVEMARIVAMGADAHTSLPILGRLRRYPVRLQWFSDGLFAVQAGTPYARALGRKLVRIGDTSINDAYAKVAAVIPHENDYWVRQLSPDYLICPEVLHALGIVPQLGTAGFTFQDAGGDTFSLNLPPGDIRLIPAPHKARPVIPLYQRSPALFYWFDYLPEARTLYIKYNNCEESPLLPMAEFGREVVAFIESNPVDRIVLDLRNNSGGDSNVIVPLLNALGQALVSGVLRLPAGGYALIGRQTFSSGMLNAIDLKQGGAMLVGEPTGGKPGGFGDTRSFVLPNSRLTVFHSTRLVGVAPGFEGPTVPPDVAVEITSADYFAERDPFLEAALRLTAPLPLPPAGSQSARR